jgi:hypothetical protein
MIPKTVIATLLLVLATIGVGASSYYVTDVQQAHKLERLHEQRRAAEMTNLRAEELLVRQATSRQAADEVLSRWNSRYKYIPTTLNTADMVEYIEGLTRDGFEQFDMYLTSEVNKRDFSTRTYNVSGTAFFRSFYDLLWHLENNREFYRIHDVSVKHTNVFRPNRATGVDRRLDMVAFTFKLEAFYSGVDGISAPADSLKPIPLAILHDHYPSADTFTPLVRTDLPPNDEQLVDVEQGRLISIVGQQAIFEDRFGRHVLIEGDRVYLGQIESIDPVLSVVRVRLNKGDRVETINIRVAGALGAPPIRTGLGNEIQGAPANQP